VRNIASGVHGLLHRAAARVISSYGDVHCAFMTLAPHTSISGFMSCRNMTMCIFFSGEELAS
jgi:hypothetical protein